jgi:murein DD-endopeptidase MepM/ murein hydrolase activator NlpD
VTAHAVVTAALLVFAVIGTGSAPAGVAPPGTVPLLQVAAFSMPGLASSAPTTTVTRLESPSIPLAVVSSPLRQETLSLRPSDGTQQQQTLTALRERNVASATETSTAVPTNDTVVAARVQEVVSLFYRYQVQTGDTVSGIAVRFGIESQYILWNNIDIISDTSLLSVGTTLQIPSVEGIIHQVKVGETISDIATQYEANASDIIGFPANELANNPNLLKEGSTILVPGGEVVAKPAPTLRPTPPPQVAAVEVAPPPVVSAVDVRPQSRHGFIWPVLNNVTSYFGPRHPLGIDIEAPYVPVSAARAGQVVFAGGDPCCSYGLNVVIRHDGGFETRYAHLSRVAVKLGQWVEIGEQVGVSGSTGFSTGPHLHFEVLLNGVIQNPIVYLP